MLDVYSRDKSSAIGNDSSLWILIGTLIGGLIVGALVIMYAEKGNSPAALLSRCLMGFLVAIVWIMAIADQVVNVLQVCRFISHGDISDSTHL